MPRITASMELPDYGDGGREVEVVGTITEDGDEVSIVVESVDGCPPSKSEIAPAEWALQCEQMRQEARDTEAA